MRKSLKILPAVLVLFGAAAGISYATSAVTRTATSVLQACANATNGNLRLVPDNQSDCRTNETPVSWNVVGPAGPQGPQGLPGKDGADGKDGASGQPGKDGANGVSPTVAQLPVGDTNCPTGGASITDAAGNIAYVCNGAKGDTGASGTPFSGAFQSPDGSFKLSVSDTGIRLQGPSSKLTLDGSSLTVESSAALTVKAGSDLAIDSGAGLTVKAGSSLALESGGVTSLPGPLVTIGGSGCAPALRLSDISGAFVGVGGPGQYPVTFPSLVGAPDVCIG